MATSEERLAQAVDEALDPAWPHERRRALRRWSYSTVGRVAAGLLGVWVLAFIIGMRLPWTFFGCMGSLMTLAAFSQAEGREHLRRE